MDDGLTGYPLQSFARNRMDIRSKDSMAFE